MRILDQAYAGKIGRFSASFFSAFEGSLARSRASFWVSAKADSRYRGSRPVALRNSIFPGEEIGPNRVSSDKVQSGSHSSRAIRKKTNFFRNRPCRDIRSPTYFVESRVQARISIYIYIYVALLEKESILDVKDVEAKKRKEKGRKAKRNGGDRAPARCTPHRHLSFRSSARPNIFRLYNKRSLCSHKLCKSMPRVI